MYKTLTLTHTPTHIRINKRNNINDHPLYGGDATDEAL